MMDAGVRRLAELLAASEQIVAFTGAGVSTESGIPDFRSPGGVWDRYGPINYRDFLRDPEARWIRIPLGVLFVLGGLLWFLPVLGIEMLPIGLLLIAQDVPFLRGPVGRLTLWLERKWSALRRWWKHA